MAGRELSSQCRAPSGVSFCLWCEKLVSCFNKLRREKQGKAKQKKRLLHALIGGPGPYTAQSPSVPEGCLCSRCVPRFCVAVKIVENSAVAPICFRFTFSHLPLVHVVEKFLTTIGRPPSFYGQITMRACKDIHQEASV